MDAFDRIDLESQTVKPNFHRNNGKGDAFDLIPETEESLGKSVFRTLSQIPQGIAEVTPYGLFTNFSNLLALGDVNDPEEMERIKAIAEREGVPFDEEKYKQAGQEALGSFPTPSNIARIIEQTTGLPLEAKTGPQKALKFASTAGKLTPGNIPQKVVGAGTATGIKTVLEHSGLPEPLAELAGLAGGGYAGSKTPNYNINLAKTKPSGIISRGFEKLKSPVEVSENKLTQINQKVESDFRKVSDKIIAESPIGETAKNLAENLEFKQESRELLNQAQQMADLLPGSVSKSSIQKELSEIAIKKVKGFSLSEYDKSYLKFMKDSSNDIVPKNVSMGELVLQYRKNNSSLSEYFEPGSSKALNRAKRDALLDNNRAIANVLEKNNPELATVFKEGNARWTKIMDAEAVDAFIGEIFEGKINYKKIHDFFDSEGYGRIFKKSLGEKGYANFTQLMKDMAVSETPYKMLQVAKNRGFEDLFKTGMGYIIHPNLGVAKASYDLLKGTYKELLNAMLDKPQIGFHFNRAVRDLKAGRFPEANKEFKSVKAEIESPKGKTAQANEAKNIEIKAEPIISKANESTKTSSKPPNKDLEIKKIEYKPKEIPKSEKPIIKLPETRGSGKIFHGSPNELEELTHGHYSSLNYYGQGFYTTDALDIASGYSLRKGKAKNPTIYEITEKKPVKLYDMESSIPKEIKKELENLKYHEAIQENLSKNPKQTLRELYDEMRDSDYAAHRIQEEFDTIARKFEKLGYEGFIHEGGRISGTKPHKVKIYFNPEETIHINKVNDPSKYSYKNKSLTEKTKPKSNIKPISAKEPQTKKVDTQPKVEQKIEQARKNDISKSGLKKQKNFILDIVEDAIRNPNSNLEKINIDVPGDGEFKINNSPTALKKFKEQVEKKWPDKPYRPYVSKKYPQYKKYHFGEY